MHRAVSPFFTAQAPFHYCWYGLHTPLCLSTYTQFSLFHVNMDGAVQASLVCTPIS